MVITVICDVLGEENNGTTIAAMNLIRALQSYGHTVRVVCGSSPICENTNGGGIEYYTVKQLSFGKLLDKYVDKVGVQITKPDNEVLRKAITGSDLVHVMLPFAVGKAGLKIAKELNIPVTAGFHMMAQNLSAYLKLIWCGPLNNYIYHYIWKHFYQYVDAIHYPTQFVKDVFEKHIKRKTNGYIISNGVNDYVHPAIIERPTEFKDKIVISTVGRYAREKSQDTLIKAVKYSKHKDDIQLILAGQGVKEKYFKKLAKNLKNPPLFKFYSRTEVIDMLNYSDLYVHPAQVELEGISCLEAIRCGKLVISSDSKNTATKGFVVDDRCLFKSRNPRSLAKVIDYWIEHPEEKVKIEQKYLQSSPSYDHALCMKQMEQMMLEMINGKKSSN